MNYIKRLEQELKAERARYAALDGGLTDILVYVSSPKFHAEPHVSTTDIVLRVQEARQAANAAEFAVYNLEGE